MTAPSGSFTSPVMREPLSSLWTLLQILKSSFSPCSSVQFGFVACETKPLPERSRFKRSPHLGQTYPFAAAVEVRTIGPPGIAYPIKEPGMACPQKSDLSGVPPPSRSLAHQGLRRPSRLWVADGPPMSRHRRPDNSGDSSRFHSDLHIGQQQRHHPAGPRRQPRRREPAYRRRTCSCRRASQRRIGPSHHSTGSSNHESPCKVPIAICLTERTNLIRPF